MPDWLTYAEAAARFGISPEAVRQIVLRRKWPRRRANDMPHGQVQVLVPDDADVRARTPVGPPHVRPSDTRPSDALDTLREALVMMRDRAQAAEERAVRADAEADRARAEATMAVTQAKAQVAALRKADQQRRARGLVARLRSALRGE